jgi:CheY-like chemotaxis protein
MLETEFVEMHTTSDGLETLNVLKDAHEKDMPFDIIFIDKHMPSISGSKVIEEYREYEKSKNASPAFVISITGDPNLSDKEKDLYDHFVTKPFNTESVRAAIRDIP